MSGYFIYAQSFGWRCCVCIILCFCFFNFRFLLLIRASSGWLYVPPRQLVKRRDGTLCSSQKVLRMVKDNQSHSSTLRSVYIIDKPSLYLVGLLPASCFGRWFLILLVMTYKHNAAIRGFCSVVESFPCPRTFLNAVLLCLLTCNTRVLEWCASLSVTRCPR